MVLYKKIQKLIANIRFHLFETNNVFIYWPDFNKGILLLVFALCIIPSHLFWYVSNFQSENRIWLSESYHDYRLFTTAVQFFLTLFLLFFSLKFQRYKKFRNFMGWLIPLYFGLTLIYSAQTIGLYSPAAMGGILNILLIGFVFYKPKVIYSITAIITIFFVMMCHLTAQGIMPYAPLFSDRLNHGDLYNNSFWLKSMAVLYVPILIISALFFEVLLHQWRNREKKIEILSQIDALTNVYNRRYTTDFVNDVLKKSNRRYAIVILDLDFFKKINDNHGHEAGDEVLRCVAKVLKSTIREQDIVGRLGGEEFILVLPELHLDQALHIAERCRKTIESLKIVLKNNTILSVTASFGVALADHQMSLDDVSIQADRALYRSKEKGRNIVSHNL